MPRGRPRKIVEEIDAKRVDVREGKKAGDYNKVNDITRLWDERVKQLGIK
jgi:hypothetical protein